MPFQTGLKTEFLGSLVISFFTFNWELTIILTGPYNEKIKLINEYLSKTCWSYKFGLPLLFSILLPLILILTSAFIEICTNMKISLIQKISSDRFITHAEKAILVSRAQEAERNFQYCEKSRSKIITLIERIETSYHQINSQDLSNQYILEIGEVLKEIHDNKLQSYPS